jgi:hypothetical protein
MKNINNETKVKQINADNNHGYNSSSELQLRKPNYFVTDTVGGNKANRKCPF